MLIIAGGYQEDEEEVLLLGGGHEPQGGEESEEIITCQCCQIERGIHQILITFLKSIRTLSIRVIAWNRSNFQNQYLYVYWSNFEHPYLYLYPYIYQPNISVYTYLSVFYRYFPFLRYWQVLIYQCNYGYISIFTDTDLFYIYIFIGKTHQSYISIGIIR